ncbi:SERINE INCORPORATOR [Salix viminalis]|uniref:SERINE INCORPORATOR n=1 Tax=Salix viminalis TaxID=40686 RepID=A0A9Q0T792_SALVM|nr:SERINE INCORPORATOR [Salix viminalis]
MPLFLQGFFSPFNCMDTARGTASVGCVLPRNNKPQTLCQERMDQYARPAEAGAVNTRPSSSEVPQREVNSRLEQNRIDYSREKKKTLQARYIYGIIFLIINLKAWFFRDYGQKGVLRVSLGCFIFFSVMFLTTIKTRKLYEARSSWHSEWWALKLVLLIVSMAVPFFLHSKYIQIYGEFARVGAGVFLVLQLVSVIEFITWWNSYWMPDEQKKQSCSLGLFMSTVFYVASVCGIVVMYAFYGRKIECSLNIFFITWTAILLIVMMAMSLHSKVNRGLLSSGIMASYLVFLCWSAIRSEPTSDNCNKQKANGNNDWTTILSFLFAIGAIVMATFSTGIDSQSFQFRKDNVQEEDDIPYDYGFFHLVFAFGAMYFGMLFISWNLNNSARKWSIDVGWASTWVKIVNEWFAATIYSWKLISPTVRQTKVMDHEDSVRQSVNVALP